MLRERGVATGMYHAGLNRVTRNNTQEAFLNDEITIMVATNAFRMGIDKSDVRYIIHWNMPKSLRTTTRRRDGLAVTVWRQLYTPTL